jgi:hypothetical protein
MCLYLLFGVPKCCVSQLHHLREDGFSLVFKKFNGFEAVARAGTLPVKKLCQTNVARHIQLFPVGIRDTN